MGTRMTERDSEEMAQQDLVPAGCGDGGMGEGKKRQG